MTCFLLAACGATGTPPASPTLNAPAATAADPSPTQRVIATQPLPSAVATAANTRQVVICVANVDGSGAHKLATLLGGGLAGWFPDGQRLLVTSRADNATLVQALSVADGSLALIASAAHIQGLSLSPLGGWVAY